MAKLHIHPIGFLIMLIGLVCWVIALGGLAAATHLCNKTLSKADNLLSCSNAYQQDWWAIFFEFFLLGIMIGTCFLNLFQRFRYVYLYYLVMATGMLTLSTKSFFTRSFDAGGASWTEITEADSFTVAGVGCMLMCMVNFGLLIFVGLGAAKAPEQHQFQSVSTAAPPTGMGSNVATSGQASSTTAF